MQDIQEFLDKDESINLSNEDGTTLLMMAAMVHKYEIFDRACCKHYSQRHTDGHMCSNSSRSALIEWLHVNKYKECEMKFKNITVVVMVGLLYGCASSPSISSKAGIYDETKNRYLTGMEIKSLMTGKTMEYPDKHKTKEYIYKSGIVYTFYEKDENYTNGHWCVVDNKFCFDYEGMKLVCPTITMKSNGKIFYEDEGYITLINGDKYDLKKTNSENGWTINKKSNCI